MENSTITFGELFFFFNFHSNFNFNFKFFFFLKIHIPHILLRNKCIHIVFVPILWWTGAIFFCLTPPLIDATVAELAESVDVNLPPIIQENLILNVGFVLFLFYALYYLTLDFFAGLTFDVILFALFLSANAFIKTFGFDLAWKYALAIHIFSWYMQIHPGHTILEGELWLCIKSSCHFVYDLHLLIICWIILMPPQNNHCTYH